MSTIILNVVIILGIIIAGGFLIFFVGDLLLSIIDPKSDERKIKNKRKKDVENFNKDLNKLSEAQKQEVLADRNVAQILALTEDDKPQKVVDEKTGAVVESYEFSEKSDSEDVVEAEENSADSEEPSKEEIEAKRIQEAREALERRKAEILKRLQEQQDEEDEEEENTEEETEAEEVEEDAEETESVEEQPEENVAVEVEEIAEEQEEDSEALDAERRALTLEKERYMALVMELEKKKSAIESELVASGKVVGNKEYYLQKLAEKEKALADNDKELRMCNKEYKPLARVQQTLERDEKKLRIKEAQVAKQKVVLYGVNNYSDIDEEKAKKLSEDLDLLDGLKLSVQHCREVMQSNKDRLPILERMQKMLSKQKADLEKDIADLKKTIESFEN